MAGDPSRISIWTGYFDSRLTRRQGRRVNRDCSIPNPNLEQLAYAAKSLREKMKDKQGTKELFAQVAIDQIIHIPFIF